MRAGRLHQAQSRWRARARVCCTMTEALRIAIVGAESTGKTALAHALGSALAAAPGQTTSTMRERRRVAVVPEALREWCEEAGRTPRADEQARIARVQHQRIEAAAAGHQVVVCDTTALMTAVYSRWIFGDDSLDALAVELHRSMSITLLTALDLPWVADGHQRDGPQVREPVDTLLREMLARHGLPFSVIGGPGPARLAQALAALRPLLRVPPPEPHAVRASARFTSLVDDGVTSGLRRWTCECCVPEAERASRPP
jgi:nicotinamide riboside kinase